MAEGRSGASGPTGTATGSSLLWSNEPHDAEWDRFVATHPLGHHTQASLWAQVKAPSGWETARLMLERDGRPVGGAQILHRRLAPGVRVGYLTRGPLLPAGEETCLAEVMKEIEVHARRLRIRHLTIQPPDESLPAYGADRGYRRGTLEVTPSATVLVDLDPPLDELLASMSSRTRYNIRLAGRREIAVREGTEEDLGLYYQMYLQTAERQGFRPSSRSYFDRMWTVLRPGGHLRLSVAEHAGRPVSGHLAVAFGDTVVNKMSVWSGREGPRRPNESLQWAVMTWARQAGFRVYDMEGLSRKAAEALRETGQLPARYKQSVGSYKLGFGGRAVVYPQPLEFLPDPSLRRLYGGLVERVDPKSMKRMVQKVRVRNR